MGDFIFSTSFFGLKFTLEETGMTTDAKFTVFCLATLVVDLLYSDCPLRSPETTECTGSQQCSLVSKPRPKRAHTVLLSPGR